MWAKPAKNKDKRELTNSRFLYKIKKNMTNYLKLWENTRIMKLRNKILASILAIVVGLGVVGLPQLGRVLTNAYTPTASTSVLEVKNLDKTYGVSDSDNIIKFSDYCSTPNAKVELRSPDGLVMYSNDVVTVISGVGGTTEIHNEAKFKTPGLYALQFRLNSNGVTVYSDVIYIPVNSDSVGTIALDGKLNAKVAPNTAVIIPMPITANWTEDSAVTIKVFTPYGEEVEATKSSVTGKWSFVNKAGVIGQYFVEYTKQVLMGGQWQTYYKYETIEFAADSINTVSTVDLEKPADVSTSGKAAIVTSNLEIEKEKTNVYIYKNYDLSNVIATKADGSTDADADIFVSVFDTVTSKYYNFTNHLFDIDTEDAAKVNVESVEAKNFILTKIENLASFGATGHSYVFKYTATSGGEDLDPVTIQRAEKFNKEDIVVTPVETVQSEQTTINIVDEVEGFDLWSMWFPSVNITANGNYNIDMIKSLVTAVRLTLSPTSGTAIQTSESNNAVNADGVGLVYTAGNILDRSFTYHYNKNMTAEMKYEVIYAIDLKYESNSTSITTDNIYTYFRTESKDKTAPSTITVEKFSNYITTQEFVVPTATVNDTDDLGNTTSGATIVANIYGGDYNGTSVPMGQKIAVLKDGTYTIKYTATDYKNNSRVKLINFIVDTNQTLSAPVLSIGATEVNKSGNKVIITTNTNADYCMVYGGTNGAVTPQKVNFEGGNISEIEYELEDVDAPSIVVFAKTNTHSTVYSAIEVNSGEISNTFKSFGYNKFNNGYTTITPNTTIEANVLDKLLWFGSKDMTVEAPEKGAYTVKGGNILTFFVAGTYIIKSTETIEINGEAIPVAATTKIIIKNTASTIKTTQPIGNKIVGKQGVEVVLNFPVAENFFGYELELVVKNSTGDIVAGAKRTEFGYSVSGAMKNDGINILFVPPADEVYSINYTLRAEDYAKGAAVISYTTGNIARPVITIASENKDVVYEGSTIKYVLAGASAIDKNGKALAVNVSVFDQYGKAITVKSEGLNQYVELTTAGFYAVYYTATDEFGKQSVATASFAVEFPEKEENDGLSAWAVVGIVFGSVAGACIIALAIIFFIKRKKAAVKFINKSKATKKKEKQEQLKTTTVYTIAESKDEKHWILKTGNRTIAKLASKQEAVDKVSAVHKKGDYVIKVYNKNGRLVDSIKNI